MKYILRTLLVIGFIPAWLLVLLSSFVYMMIGFPIVSAFILIKTGNVDVDDIPAPIAPLEYLIGKFNGLLSKIK